MVSFLSFFSLPPFSLSLFFTFFSSGFSSFLLLRAAADAVAAEEALARGVALEAGVVVADWLLATAGGFAGFVVLAAGLRGGCSGASSPEDPDDPIVCPLEVSVLDTRAFLDRLSRGRSRDRVRTLRCLSRLRRGGDGDGSP